VRIARDGWGRGVGPARVWLRGRDYPGLAMSRALGDLAARPAGVISTPELSTYTVALCSWTAVAS
jgi:hypothetical protein